MNALRSLVDLVRREPAVVSGFAGAAISLALAFGLDLSVQQQGAIMGLVVAGLAFVTRGRVTPNAKLPGYMGGVSAPKD